MDRLTNKERTELENVFAVIYNDNNPKFASFYKHFYKDFYKVVATLKTKIAKRIKQKNAI
ncbi:hypothetical protein CIG11343_1101 [Campylobacter iguaniorum]|uniref:hypothetical protein n=1 Tax=Campylobacter iguaniorum TaxID=1244531 RepID=UPI0007C91EFD|nr:hypothetical protein [Campylobacter iguaniorum]ANE36115.1 hypothetical protein CIG11343_1101 [Campylobacter iguaniorum]